MASTAEKPDRFVTFDEATRQQRRSVLAAIVLTLVFQALALTVFALLLPGKDQERVPVARKGDAILGARP